MNFLKRKFGSLVKEGMHEVNLIPGVNVSQEITRSVLDIFEAAKCPIKFEVIDNYSFDNLSHRAKLRQNPITLVGN